MDRAYGDFERLARFNDAGSFFVSRTKSNFKAQRRYSRPVDRTTGLDCDQTVALNSYYSRKGFEAPLRRFKFNDPETGKRFVFLTNNFALPALTITQLYRMRWRGNGLSSTFGSRRSSAAFYGSPFNRPFLLRVLRLPLCPGNGARGR
jgi:hypothetical protein